METPDKKQNIASKIESFLLISHKPFSKKKLAAILQVTEVDVEEVIPLLAEKYGPNSGVVLMQDGNKLQLATSPENSGLIQDWIKEEQDRELTRPSLETLTIVAYRGPVNKAEIEMIRGINCSLILRNLMIRGLIEMLPGKTEFDTRYQVTFEFLRFLGIAQAQKLPDYEKLNSDEYLKDLLNKEDAIASPSAVAQTHDFEKIS